MYHSVSCIYVLTVCVLVEEQVLWLDHFEYWVGSYSLYVDAVITLSCFFGRIPLQPRNIFTALLPQFSQTLSYPAQQYLQGFFDRAQSFYPLIP